MKKLVIAVLLIFAVFLAGCFPSLAPPSAVKLYYAVDYPKPNMVKKWGKETTLKIEYFTSYPLFALSDMVWQNTPYSREISRRQRWQSPPAVMVEHLLIRDLRQALPDLIVLAREDAEPARFVLEGKVIEFLGQEREGGFFSRVSLHLTLLDTAEKDPIKRIAWQKTYSAEERLTARNSLEMARGMSVALERINGEVILDLERTIHRRLLP